jgi:hypothetical protein
MGGIRAPTWSSRGNSSDPKDAGKYPEVDRPLNADELAEALAGAVGNLDKGDPDRGNGNQDGEDGHGTVDADSDDDDVGEHIKRLVGGTRSSEVSVEGSENHVRTDSGGTENATVLAGAPKHKSLQIFVGEGSSAGWVDAVWLQVCPVRAGSVLSDRSQPTRAFCLWCRQEDDLVLAFLLFASDRIESLLDAAVKLLWEARERMAASTKG